MAGRGRLGRADTSSWGPSGRPPAERILCPVWKAAKDSKEAGGRRGAFQARGPAREEEAKEGAEASGG